MRRIFASVSLIVFGAGAAAAQVCNSAYPIRATGAACSGPNVGYVGRQPGGDVFCCIGSSRSTGSIYAYPGGNRVGAGLAAGGAMLEVLGALLNMFGSSPSSDADARAEAEARWRGDRADARRKAAAWNASGLAQAKLGDDVSAEAHFAAAVKFAQNAGDTDAEQLYNRNMYVARARQDLRRALALQADGRINEADDAYMRAAGAARFAGRADLSEQIYRQRGDMLAQTAKSGRRIESKRSCTVVNGETLCD